MALDCYKELSSPQANSYSQMDMYPSILVDVMDPANLHFVPLRYFNQVPDTYRYL